MKDEEKKKLNEVIAKLKSGSDGDEKLMSLIWVGRNYSKKDLLDDLRELLGR